MPHPPGTKAQPPHDALVLYSVVRQEAQAKMILSDGQTPEVIPAGKIDRRLHRVHMQRPKLAEAGDEATIHFAKARILAAKVDIDRAGQAGVPLIPLRKRSTTS